MPNQTKESSTRGSKKTAPHTSTKSAKSSSPPVKEELLKNGITVLDSISILAPATRIYEFWRNLSMWPKFFNQLESVTVISDTLSHWVWKALKDQKTIEWDSHITEDIPGVAISWQTIGDSEVQHAGTVRFTELPFGRGTLVDVKMLYAPPGGKLTELTEKVLGESPKQNLRTDLKKLREIIETGEIPSTEGQPHGNLH